MINIPRVCTSPWLCSISTWVWQEPVLPSVVKSFVETKVPNTMAGGEHTDTDTSQSWNPAMVGDGRS